MEVNDTKGIKTRRVGEQKVALVKATSSGPLAVAQMCRADMVKVASRAVERSDSEALTATGSETFSRKSRLSVSPCEISDDVAVQCKTCTSFTTQHIRISL
eukprot:scaffold2708_cov158-Ochromonas_danica.AAC.36